MTYRSPLGDHWATLHVDELHVISDLHFGGAHPGAQIFASTDELESLVDQLARASSTRAITLAINGDFIDFLAELPSVYFDPIGAIAKLDRVVRDPSFAPVFAALRRFAATPNRSLVINLGNHDLELALPWVREHLLADLCPDAAARTRVRVVTDGTGVTFRVGRAKVLLAHGNEVDSWNVADFERIRRIGRDLLIRGVDAAWTPNAGTQMVIDVMNGIKKRFPFVDLLKPEAGAVIPTLIALDPSVAGQLAGLAAVAARLGVDATRRAIGFLGEAGAAPEGADPDASDPFLALDSATPVLPQPGSGGEQLMDFVERELRKGVTPFELIRAPEDAQLGFWSATWSAVQGRRPDETLREMLEKLDKDRSFETNVKDATSRRLDALVAPDVDVLIAGHTHLERALPRKSGWGYYYNSGTWARLLRIAPEVRQDPARFQRLFEVLQGGSMLALDAEPELTIRRCSVVSVIAGPNGTASAELRRVARNAQGAFEALPVPGTQYTTS